ncbi:replication initiation protein, partial [Campylobacter fetus]|uniref:replication initiation protein n=1 Tax=Campylobacter fetus TaxID=196 RepID=UPI0013D1C508
MIKDSFTRNQSNTSSAITTAKTKMTANELKAFYQCSTLLTTQDMEFTEYQISVSDFVSSLGFSETNAEYVKNLCRHLAKQTFEIEKNGIWDIYTIFSRFRFDTKNQLITIKFNPDMKPYLLQLKNNFTQIKEVKYIKEFDSKYAIRIYALLKDYRKMSHRDMNLEALSKMLQLPKSYRDFGYINAKVLIPAMEEINEKSDIKITSIEPIEKLRKKIISIRINFENKAKKQADDVIARLQKLYDVENKNPNVFIGFKFALTDTPKSPNELRLITKIEADDRPYFTAYSSDDTIIAVLGKKEFIQKLVNGIYRGLIFEAEQEKKQQLPVDEWQKKQDFTMNYLA